MSPTIGGVPYVDAADKISDYPGVSKTIALKIGDVITDVDRVKLRQESNPFQTPSLDTMEQTGTYYGQLATSAKLANRVVMWRMNVINIGGAYIAQYLEGFELPAGSTTPGNPFKAVRYVNNESGGAKIATASWQTY